MKLFMRLLLPCLMPCLMVASMARGEAFTLVYRSHLGNIPLPETNEFIEFENDVCNPDSNTNPVSVEFFFDDDGQTSWSMVNSNNVFRELAAGDCARFRTRFSPAAVGVHRATLKADCFTNNIPCPAEFEVSANVLAPDDQAFDRDTWVGDIGLYQFSQSYVLSIEGELEVGNTRSAFSFIVTENPYSVLLEPSRTFDPALSSDRLCLTGDNPPTLEVLHNGANIQLRGVTSGMESAPNPLSTTFFCGNQAPRGCPSQDMDALWACENDLYSINILGTQAEADDPININGYQPIEDASAWAGMSLTTFLTANETALAIYGVNATDVISMDIEQASFNGSQIIMTQNIPEQYLLAVGNGSDTIKQVFVNDTEITDIRTLTQLNLNQVRSATANNYVAAFLDEKGARLRLIHLKGINNTDNIYQIEPPVTTSNISDTSEAIETTVTTAEMITTKSDSPGLQATGWLTFPASLVLLQLFIR